MRLKKLERAIKLFLPPIRTEPVRRRRRARHDRPHDNIPDRAFYLFDTFAGMPATDPGRDLHKAGDFSDTSLDTVRRTADAFIRYHPGFVPETFGGREADRIAFAHVDLDIYQSIQDSCEFIYPRLLPGGFLIFDDYGFMSCPGARQAVDEFFAGRPEVPLVLPTGQAVVFRGFGV